MHPIQSRRARKQHGDGLMKALEKESKKKLAMKQKQMQKERENLLNPKSIAINTNISPKRRSVRNVSSPSKKESNNIESKDITPPIISTDLTPRSRRRPKTPKEDNNNIPVNNNNIKNKDNITSKRKKVDIMSKDIDDSEEEIDYGSDSDLNVPEEREEKIINNDSITTSSSSLTTSFHSINTTSITHKQQNMNLSLSNLAKVFFHSDKQMQTLDYFSQQNITTISSAPLSNILKRRRMGSITAKKQRKLLKNYVEARHLSKVALQERYSKYYRQWFLYLHHNYNLLFFGFGSKKECLQRFAREWLSDGPVIVINGYFPAVSIKNILTSITSGICHHTQSFASLILQLEFINAYLTSSECFVSHIYLLVHNIDGIGIRDSLSQLILSYLASIPRVHVIASVDHNLSSLLWDHRHLQRYNWLSYDMTTYKTYEHENRYQDSVTGGGAEHRATGISYVLQSLTPNHRDILTLLAEKQLEFSMNEQLNQHNKQNNNNDEKKKESRTVTSTSRRIKKFPGLTFQEFFSLCTQSMLVSSDSTLRAHLSELKDHNLIETKSKEGHIMYCIPYTDPIIQHYIIDGAEHAVDEEMFE